MRKRVPPMVLVALTSCALGAAPAWGKGKPRRPTPDLTVESVSANGLGAPLHIVVDPSGAPTGSISVRVVVRNVGKLPAPPSEALAVLGIYKGVFPLGVAKFKEIKPGKARSDVITVDRLTDISELGLGTLGVFANEGNAGYVSFKENNRRNNEGHLKQDVAVIPYEWKVPKFEAKGRTPSGYTAVTKAEPSAFSFRFNAWNQTLGDWEWYAQGTIKAETTGEALGCQVTGHGEATHPRWETAVKGRQGLFLDRGLTTYEGSIYGSVENKYPLTFVGCPQGLIIPPGSENDIQDLLTSKVNGGDVDAMEPSETELEGSGENSFKVFSSWTFKANIPSH